MINVTKTYLPSKEKFKNYVDEIYSTGWLTNNGPLKQRLEAKLKEYLGVKNIILVSNGTSALQVAYKLLDLSGEVITTPFSFVATTSSQVWGGLTPVFADIDKDTLCIDPKKIEEKITEKTTAIVPVHVFGNACEVEEIEKIAKKHNLKVIYDAAHAFDVKYNDEKLLNYGDVSTLSFHCTKLFHTIEGGALIFNDDDLYEKAKKLINFGIAGPDNIEYLGINCKMNEFQAAMGLCVLDEIDIIENGREKVYNYYVEAFKENDSITLQKINENIKSNYAYFPVVFESEEMLLQVREALNSEQVSPRRYFYPSLDTLCYLKNKQYMPISNDISKRVLCLPMYDSLTKKELDKISNIILETISLYDVDDEVAFARG
ncbi:DegT/DnrJ/EryC1/StrS family aminotransferase [Clostridium algoriphilum]|uniref:DegT/DnrJ/EryC1/StrS family aminotransferase n=1 Tax=Clostridium algoriphilum TaxID=198347 RepID=UPI001CF5B97C|nr:DegT/DnrJ/EryC1/StrS family aminotransferase [Clostridium algoriphilum]MCB2295339.1 DegT/DnrJ/EryC1/StrS family aminotransferase [Clostridium algoriphilum]